MNNIDKQLLKQLKRIGKQFLKEGNKEQAREIVACIKELKASDSANADVTKTHIQRRREKLNSIQRMKSEQLRELYKLMDDSGKTLEDKLAVKKQIDMLEHTPNVMLEGEGLDLDTYSIPEEQDKLLDSIFESLYNKKKIEKISPENSLSFEKGMPKENSLSAPTLPVRKKPKPKGS